jgi:hypothetical protein
MRGGLSLINTKIVKDGVDHTIVAVYATCLNYLYLGVKNSKNGSTENYKVTDFKSFLAENNFALLKDVARDYQFDAEPFV